MEDLVLEESGYCQATGIYYPKWENSPPLPPHHHPLSLPAFLLPHHVVHHHLKPAFVDAKSRRAVSYADARASVSSLARLLRLRHGIRKGDVVLLVAPNSVDFPVLALAIMASGAVFSTANPMNTRAELQMQVDDSRPVLIVTTAELRHKLDGLGPSTSSPPLLVDDLLQSATSSNNGTQWTDHHDYNNNNNNSMILEQGDTAALMYSSGTTGKSKAVVCTHRNLITMGCLLRHVWRRSASESEIYLCVVPLFHMFGLSVFVCGAVAAGATVVVLANGRYSMEEAMAAVEEHGVSRLPAVPPMVVDMVRRGGVGKGYDLSSLKEVICSGAPLAREFMERFPLCYPHVTLSQVSGGHEVEVPTPIIIIF